MLMEVMELREQLSNAKSKEEKSELRKQVEASFKKHENAFRCSLCRSIVWRVNWLEEEFDTLCDEAVAMKYYDSIIKELNEAGNWVIYDFFVFTNTVLKINATSTN